MKQRSVRNVNNLRWLVVLGVLFLMLEIIFPPTLEQLTRNTGFSFSLGVMSYAQEKNKSSGKRRTIPNVSEATYRRLSEIEEFVTGEDLDSAQKVIDQMLSREQRYNQNEVAQIHRMAAWIAHERDDTQQAIKHYEEIVEHSEFISEGMEQNAIKTLAQLYFAAEDFDKSLELMEKWIELGVDPKPTDYALIGVALYMMKNYQGAIDRTEQAIDLASQLGIKEKRQWWDVLRVSYYELEDYPKTVEILELMVEKYPRREYWVSLAGMYGQIDQEKKQMYAMEAAHVGGYFGKSSDYRNFSALLANEGAYWRAAKYLNEGFEKEIVENNYKNLNVLGQRYQAAIETNRAIEVFEQARELAEDGKLFERLARLYYDLDEYEKCTEAAKIAIDKGGLQRVFNIETVMGICFVERSLLEQARQAFVSARNNADRAENRTASRTANVWIKYIDKEVKRRAALAKAAG